MRFQSTFRLPPRRILPISMSPRQKAGRGSPRSKAGAKSVPDKELLEKVLAASGQWQASGGSIDSVRHCLAESARRIFRASVAGIMVNDREGYVLTAVSAAGKEESGLLSRARSFASEAIASKKLLSFRFTSRDVGVEGAHAGLAQPVLTSRTTSVLLVVRGTAFFPAETHAFNVLCSLARLALDNAELAGLYAAQQQNLDEHKKRAEDLMEMSLDLGSALRLPDFV